MKSHQQLHQLIDGAETAGEDRKPPCITGQHQFPRRKMLKVELMGQIGIGRLVVRQLNIESDRNPTSLMRSSISGLHDAGPTSRHDGHLSSGQPFAQPFSALVVAIG